MISTAELTYLVFVIVGFSGFAASLAFVSWWSRKPRLAPQKHRAF